MPVAVQGGLVYVLSSAGVVAAVDAIDGELQWISRYERAEVERVSRHRGPWGGMPGTGPVGSANTWLPSPPIVKDDGLFIAPADSTLLVCLDARTGKHRWQATKNREASHLIGVTRDLVITGGDRLFARDVVTGSGKWDTKGRPCAGRGILSEDHVYVPEEDVIAQYGLVSEGKREREFPIPVMSSTGDRFRTGNLVLLDGFLLAAHDWGVSVFEIAAKEDEP
jgi:outer membrane protein assembly factor BamB